MNEGKGFNRRRDPERIDEILNLIKTIWVSFPESRLMQILNNVMSPKANDISETFFYLEDEDLKKYLKKYLKQWKGE